MSSKNEIARHLREIIAAKNKSYLIFKDLTDRLQDPVLKEKLGRIAFDSKEHKELLEQVLQLVA